MISPLPLIPADLHWQAAHEVKRMRMRIKQQYWRAAGDAEMMARILVARFSSLVHLMRAVLYLSGRPAPLTPQAILDAAAEAWPMDREFAGRMLEVKRGQTRLKPAELAEAFGGLMELIRAVDSQIDRLAV